jgi:hypothetical protein
MADRQFSDGELIYRFGDPADGVYRVRSGGVRLQRGGGDTSELSYLGADAVFGENGFLTGETRDTDAVAVGDVQVEFLRRNEFLAILSVQRHLLSATFEPVFNLVRDCGSYHGTTLNGQILGGEGRPSSAPLMSGESELVAGRADSPFRFRILVQ